MGHARSNEASRRVVRLWYGINLSGEKVTTCRHVISDVVERQTELKLHNQLAEIYIRLSPRISRAVMLGSGVGVIGTRGTFPRFNPSVRPPPTPTSSYHPPFYFRCRLFICSSDVVAMDNIAIVTTKRATKNYFTPVWRWLRNIGEWGP